MIYKLSEYIAVGEILRPHGCRGEVRVLPLTDFPERFDGMKKVLVEKKMPFAGKWPLSMSAGREKTC